MKILFIQNQGFINGKGGTEKVCVLLANYFSSLGCQVEIATNEDAEGTSAFPLNKEVDLINIYNPKNPQIKLYPIYRYKGSNPFLWFKFKIKKEYAKIKNKIAYKKMGGKEEVYLFNLKNKAKVWKDFIEKSNPNVIITMSIASLLEITYKNMFSIPIINSTNGRPDYDYTDVLWYRSKLDMECLENSYNKLSGIQVLFENYKDFLPKTFKGKAEVIPNIVPQLNENELVNHLEKKKRYKITHLASLIISCKQQDMLIRVFKNIAEKYPDWDLHFWGTGQDYDLLREMVKKYNLEKRVFLNGFTVNPLNELKKSDIFVFPSKYEGFGLALTEAQSVGLPCIGLADCSGVNQLISHGENGFLANNEEEIQAYLEKLIEDEQLRQQIGKEAHCSVKKYSPNKVLNKWEKFVFSVINNKNV